MLGGTFYSSLTTLVGSKRMLRGWSESLCSHMFAITFLRRSMQEHPTVKLALKRYRKKSFGSVSEKAPDRHADAKNTATHYPNRSRPCCCSLAHSTILLVMSPSSKPNQTTKMQVLSIRMRYISANWVWARALEPHEQRRWCMKTVGADII
jgi:hypothetical protein